VRSLLEIRKGPDRYVVLPLKIHYKTVLNRISPLRIPNDLNPDIAIGSSDLIPLTWNSFLYGGKAQAKSISQGDFLIRGNDVDQEPFVERRPGLCYKIWHLQNLSVDLRRLYYTTVFLSRVIS
jgi:hypothetical protein